MKHFVPLLGIALILMSACNNTTSVDLIVYGGAIHSMDSANSVYQAMAVNNGKVVAVGTENSIMDAYDGTMEFNLNGGNLYPGLIDAHCHLYGLGEQGMIVDLIGSGSPQEVIDRTAAAAKDSDITWIRGRGWDQNDWENKSFPTRRMLDEAFPDRPVFLVRVDGHAAWVNSKALEIANITASTPNPEGGKILRSNGVPTGILIDNAVELVREHIPSPDIEQYKAGYRAAIDRCLAVGLTGGHDMGLNAAQIKAIQQLIDEGAFPFRVTGYVDGTGETWDALCNDSVRIFGNDQLTLAGLKLYADGALGSRGALLLEPYSDDPRNRGVAITTEEIITREAVRALNADLQVCVHAIGDSAVRLVLNAYESAIRQTGNTEIPLRIEHAQIISPQDLPRFEALGVIPSMQPTHCTSDMYWAEARLGPVRVLSAYPWQTLLRSGCLMPFGSDFPVEHPNPFAGIYAACTRRDKYGVPASAEDIAKDFTLAGNSTIRELQYRDGWYGSERVSRLDALRGFTTSASQAALQGRKFGQLTPGSYADFIATTINIEGCEAAELLKQPVSATFVAGKLVYNR